MEKHKEKNKNHPWSHLTEIVTISILVHTILSVAYKHNYNSVFFTKLRQSEKKKPLLLPLF